MSENYFVIKSSLINKADLVISQKIVKILSTQIALSKNELFKCGTNIYLFNNQIFMHCYKAKILIYCKT